MSVGVFFQNGINYYVPKMQASPGVGDDGLYSVSLGAPAVAAANSVITTANGAITNAAKVFSAAILAAVLPYTVDAVYGRNVTVQGGTAGDNAVLVVRGVDYLGQPTAEQLTLAGVASVVGNKAFKRIDTISVAAGNANANSTIQVGLGTKLGLPFKTNVVIGEYNGDAVAAAGTLATPVVTDPATLITGDPRGTYIASTALNGANVISITARSSKTTNANDNGGLHGIRQFFA